jgi:hypothetical protein
MAVGASFSKEFKYVLSWMLKRIKVQLKMKVHLKALSIEDNRRQKEKSFANEHNSFPGQSNHYFRNFQFCARRSEL